MPAPLIDEAAILTGKAAESFVGGPMWNTTIIVTGAGAEQRFKRWTQPRYKYQLDEGPRPASVALQIEQFFIARDGEFGGFRFEDYADYQISFPTDTIQLTATTWQIQKTYQSGSVSRSRMIYKPVAGSVAVFNQSNGVVGGWTVDTTTGIVTFSIAPAYVPKVTCSFHVPVRLDTAEFSRNMISPTGFEIRGIQLIELR